MEEAGIEGRVENERREKGRGSVRETKKEGEGDRQNQGEKRERDGGGGGGGHRHAKNSLTIGDVEKNHFCIACKVTSRSVLTCHVYVWTCKCLHVSLLVHTRVAEPCVRV